MPTDEEAWPGIDPAAIGFIRDYCGWHIAPLREDVVHTTSDGGHLFTLRTLRLVNLISIEMDGKPVDLAAGVGDALPRVQWAEEGLVWWPGRWSSRFRGLVVQFSHGFETVPPALVAVAKRLKYALRDGTGPIRVGNISVTPGSSGGAATAGMDPTIVAVLDRYRLPDLS